MNVFDSKKEADCSKDAGHNKFPPCELYHFLKINHNHSYLKKLELDDGSMLKKETVCQKRKNKINSKRWKSKEQIHKKLKAKVTSALYKAV